jgi:hypothetical protein
MASAKEMPSSFYVSFLPEDKAQELMFIGALTVHYNVNDSTE